MLCQVAGQSVQCRGVHCPYSHPWPTSGLHGSVGGGSSVFGSMRVPGVRRGRPVKQSPPTDALCGVVPYLSHEAGGKAVSSAFL